MSKISKAYNRDRKNNKKKFGVIRANPEDKKRSKSQKKRDQQWEQAREKKEQLIDNQ
jgi:hypothetical protein